MKRRQALRLVAALSAGAASSAAQAQSYPSRPIRLVLGFPPGSATDFIARLLAPKMAEGLGQPVVVENRPGAAGIIAATMVSQAAPDGYTIMVSVPGAVTIARALSGDKLQYSPETDLVPISLIGTSPLLLVVKSDSGIKTAAEFVERARATPGGLNVASYGVGSPSHFAVEMLRVQSKLPITHMPHTGSAALQTALLGGIVPAGIDSLTAAMPLIASGRVTALAITAEKRSEVLPDVPTTEEAGLGAVVLGGWAGLHGPKGLPPEIVRRLNAEMDRVLALPEIRQQMGHRLLLSGGPPSVFAEHIRVETERLARLVKQANITAN
jgi:tripartite-type tricarboxylate transporter receptor subunit TctC